MHISVTDDSDLCYGEPREDERHQPRATRFFFSSLGTATLLFSHVWGGIHFLCWGGEVQQTRGPPRVRRWISGSRFGEL